MKKQLFTIFILAIAFISKAQTYYPTGTISSPTWSYDGVISDNNGNYYNSLTGMNGNNIDDATLYFNTFNRGDAYDGAFEFFVNTEDSVYTESGYSVIGGVDTTGTTITTAEQWIDGFFVSKSYYFSTTDPVVRAVFKIRNPTMAVKSAKIGIYSNMGSDGSTVLKGSSTTGTVLVNADRWMVTSDNRSYASGDPILTWARFGPGTIASAPVFGLKPEAGSDEFVDTIAVTVPANSYKLIMQFNRMDTTAAAALTNASVFNSVVNIKAKGYLFGMTNPQLLNVVNWDFGPIICSTVSVNNPQTICSGNTYVINSHTYTASGVYNDTLHTVIGGCDSVIVTNLSVISCVGIKELNNTTNSVIIFPNPTTGILNIEVGILNEEKHFVEVLNTIGQIVYTQNLTSKLSLVDLHDLTNGVYFIKVTSGKLSTTKRLILNK